MEFLPRALQSQMCRRAKSAEKTACCSEVGRESMEMVYSRKKKKDEGGKGERQGLCEFMPVGTSRAGEWTCCRFLCCFPDFLKCIRDCHNRKMKF